MKPAKAQLLAAWVIFGFLGPTARGELVYFTKGGEAQLPAEMAGETVRLETPDGTFEFLPGDFRRIVPGHWPAKEWETRAKSARSGGVEGRFSAAWWALENGLTPEAVAMLREAHESDPGHAPTARMVTALDRLAKPCTDPDLERLERSLGGRFEQARGPHVVLFHQHRAEEAEERVDLLERVATSYYLMLASQGIELPVPSRRMASAWFAERHDYLAFLHAENADVFKTTRGYYHPTLDAVVAYDARSFGTQKTALDAIEHRKGELRRLGEAIDQLPARGRLKFEVRGEPTRTLNRTEGRTLLKDLERDLRRRELLLGLDVRAIDLGTAAHEMVHQVVAASGLAPRHDAFPIWLHEGFASQFEVIRGGRWAGVGRAHDLRLPDWRAIHPRPSLLPLLQDHGFGQGYKRSIYAQSWALVYYLRKSHPREFLTYLDLLRAPDSTPSRPISAFRTTFGRDLEQLEGPWYEFMAAVKTPLEEEKRPGKPRPSDSSSVRN